MNEITLSIGSVVTLKGQTQAMTVVGLLNPTDNLPRIVSAWQEPRIVCAWHDSNGTPCESNYPPHALALVTAKKAKK